MLSIYRLIPVSSPSGDHEEVLAFEVIFGDHSQIDFSMSESLLKYVLENASCSRCLEQINNVSHLHTCKRTAKSDFQWSSPSGRMFYVPTGQAKHFRKLWNREATRLRSLERASKLRKIPRPPDEILLELKNQQGNRCYYCFNEFETNSSTRNPHLDHFVSVAKGGNNSIFNLVYACARCNREKCSEDGEAFIKTLSIPGIPATERLAMMEKLLKDHHRAMPNLNSPEHGAWAYEAMKLLQQKQRIERESKKMPIGSFRGDAPRNISKMRESVREWKEQFRPKYLKHVESLLSEHSAKIPQTNTPEFDNWANEECKLLLRLECIRRESTKS